VAGIFLDGVRDVGAGEPLTALGIADSIAPNPTAAIPTRSRLRLIKFSAKILNNTIRY